MLISECSLNYFSNLMLDEQLVGFRQIIYYYIIIIISISIIMLCFK